MVEFSFSFSSSFSVEKGGWMVGVEDYKKDCLWCIFMGGLFRFFFWDVVVSSFCFFPPPLLGNKHICASSSSIYYYISTLHYLTLAAAPIDAHTWKYLYYFPNQKSPFTTRLTPPIAHAMRHSEARSRLAVSLPQCPIPFEVIPIHHQMNHSSGQRIFLLRIRHT